MRAVMLDYLNLPWRSTSKLFDMEEMIMADSTLDPDNLPTRDRQLGKGHGTRALGPSDLSDSGSDIIGNEGLAEDETIPLDTGTNEDPEHRTRHSAGPDVGDADLSSDSDSGGTGEHATAGRDTWVREGADIGFDEVQRMSETPLEEDFEGIEGTDEIDDSMDPDKDPGWRGRPAGKPHSGVSRR